MKEFVSTYKDRIHGVLSCFDRVIFRGYLPIMSGWAMAEFLYQLNQKSSSLRAFLHQNSERVKTHAIAMAKQHGRPFQYLRRFATFAQTIISIRPTTTLRMLADRRVVGRTE